ncbi:MAG: molybdate ABC transporter substrate-binding protein [Thermodesulfobacteriota bacterium]|jgi:molybdate transport system substrate-binding protein
MTSVRQILHNVLAVVVLALSVPYPSLASSSSLMIFAGAASKPPTEEVAKIYKQKRGVEVQVTFGGSGFVLSQMKLAHRGDVYFPGSSDFMEKAKRDGLVFPETERIVAYLIPAINVQKGNPWKIQSLKDLLKPGLRLAIADPESVCVGAYAVEVVEKNLTPKERALFRKKLVTTVESCEKTANIISLKGVDAVIGWEVFERWDPQRIETVLLRASQVPRIGYIAAAVSAFTRDRVLAEQFIHFLISPDAKAVFRKHGYLMTLDEARKFALPDTPVGGEYTLPKEWRKKR